MEAGSTIRGACDLNLSEAILFPAFRDLRQAMIALCRRSDSTRHDCVSIR